MFSVVSQLSGCVSDEVGQPSTVAPYQTFLAEQGPQPRSDTEGRDQERSLRLLDPLSPAPPMVSGVAAVKDPNAGQKTVPLTLEQAMARVLANSPEIRVVSFDPSIARQDITRAASEFDFTAFGRVNYEQEDSPPNSVFQPGQSDVRTYETGIKQKGITGAEWSVSYALTRSWDDLVGRPFPLRYEPIVAFQLRHSRTRGGAED
jgi:hypothetical protein